MSSLLSAILDQPQSPVQEVPAPEFKAAGLQLLIKRDDLLALRKGGAFCGNKWRKLKYNLLSAREQRLDHLLTFGGAYSNHLAAVAEAAHAFGFTSTGIVRGEETLPLNPTLRFARDCGMRLLYASREAYRHKTEQGFLSALHIAPDSAYIIPEGGANSLALAGCRELTQEILAQSTPDFIAIACGTGGTIAGGIEGLEGQSKILGLSVLKGDFLRSAVQELLHERHCGHLENWEILNGYHFGGYAKWNSELVQFINKFKAAYGIALDPVYTGKLFYSLFDLTAQGFFPSGSTVMAVHTGGLQGIAGFNERFGSQIIEDAT